MACRCFVPQHDSMLKVLQAKGFSLLSGLFNNGILIGLVVYILCIPFCEDTDRGRLEEFVIRGTKHCS